MKLASLLLAVSTALVPACSKSSPPGAPALQEAFSKKPSPASSPAASAPVAPPASRFDAADAHAFYEAFVFSLQQVGRADVAAQIVERDVTAALTRAYPSASAEIRNALDDAQTTWAQVQASWQSMALADRREFVYAVLAIGLGEPAAKQLVGQAAPRNTRGGGRSGGGGGGMPSVDYEGSSCWASAGCTGYESNGDGTGSYSFEEPSIPME